MDCSLPGSSVHGILQARMLACHFLLQQMNLSDPGIKPKSPALQMNSLPSEPPGKPSLGFSLTHKRGRESCCKVPNIFPTLRVDPVPWKVSSTCVYSVYCQSAHIQGGCCSQEQSVRHWRWDANGQVWRALDGRPMAVPTILGRGNIGPGWTIPWSHVMTAPLAGCFVQGCVQTTCGLATSHWGQRGGWYLPKQSSCPRAPGRGHTSLPLKPNVTGKGQRAWQRLNHTRPIQLIKSGRGWGSSHRVRI